jgi:phosphonate transport system substrate-binding protein
MGPASYVISKQRNADLHLLAAESNQGDKTFYGIICVREQSPIQSLAELKAKSFAFGDEQSAIGRYLAQDMLMKNGVYAWDLARYEYLGRHDRVGTAVGTGGFDAGALRDETFEQLRSEGVEIRELARFPSVAEPWIANSELDEGHFVALKETLLDIKVPKTLDAIEQDGFLVAEDSDYDLIRRSMQLNDQFFEQ